MIQKIILAPLKQAVVSLRAALTQPKTEFTRDASIQRFEYTFELTWKILKRYLREEIQIDEYRIKNIFRHAARIKLIVNTEAWFSYLNARNLTSHTYNVATAEEVYKVAQAFMQDVERLLQNLEKLLCN